MNESKLFADAMANLCWLSWHPVEVFDHIDNCANDPEEIAVMMDAWRRANPELAKVTQERDEARAEQGRLTDGLIEAQTRECEARAECDRLRADAERYRHLLDLRYEADKPGLSVRDAQGRILTRDAISDAIDAARKPT